MSKPLKPVITHELFDKTFRSVIRVGLNWVRFHKERWPIETVSLKTKKDLSRCYMPWYIGPDGKEVAYDDEHAIPMCLTDVPHSIELLHGERRDDIQKAVEKFKSEEKVIRFNAPTYFLPNDRYFILDRNHRLSALTMMTRVKFHVTLWNVCGPLDPDALLDVRHWLSQRKK